MEAAGKSLPTVRLQKEPRQATTKRQTLTLRLA